MSMLIPEKAKSLKNFDDKELKYIYYQYMPKTYHVGNNYKWDIPYFVRTIKDDKDYTLNIYKNGSKYAYCERDYSDCNFFVVNYLLIEIVNKRTFKKQYIVSYIEDNDNMDLYISSFFIDNKVININDFYMNEMITKFLSKKEYTLE